MTKLSSISFTPLCTSCPNIGGTLIRTSVVSVRKGESPRDGEEAAAVVVVVE
jgi:hypothetical protein